MLRDGWKVGWGGKERIIYWEILKAQWRVIN
jgi:hypothetical protein